MNPAGGVVCPKIDETLCTPQDIPELSQHTSLICVRGQYSLVFAISPPWPSDAGVYGLWHFGIPGEHGGWFCVNPNPGAIFFVCSNGLSIAMINNNMPHLCDIFGNFGDQDCLLMLKLCLQV